MKVPLLLPLDLDGTDPEEITVPQFHFAAFAGLQKCHTEVVR